MSFIGSCVKMVVNTWWYYFGRICELYKVGQVGESRSKTGHVLLSLPLVPSQPTLCSVYCEVSRLLFPCSIPTAVTCSNAGRDPSSYVLNPLKLWVEINSLAFKLSSQRPFDDSCVKVTSAHTFTDRKLSFL